MDSIPLLSEDLIKELDSHYCPLTPEAIPRNKRVVLAYAAGQRSVVEFLQMRLQQDKDAELDVYTESSKGVNGT